MSTQILPPVRNTVAVVDPNSPNHAIAPNSDGSINVVIESDTGTVNVVGSSASGATDDGSNPVKVGGVFLTTLPTTTNGQRVNLQTETDGSLRTAIAGIGSSSKTALGATSSFALQLTNHTASPLATSGFVYNGTTQDAAVSLGGVTTAGSGVTAAGLVSVFNSTLPTFTNAQYGALQMGVRGGLHVDLYSPDLGQAPYAPTNTDGIATTSASQYLASSAFSLNYNGTTYDRSRNIVGALAAGSAGTGTTAVEPGGTLFSQITTGTSTTVKGSAGILHKVCVNTPVASATIKIYNALSATGTPITITIPSTVTGESPFFIEYNIYMGTGIFVVTSGATDVTVTYR